MAGVSPGMRRPTRAVTRMRRRQGIPAPPAGLATEDVRAPMPSSMAGAPTVGAPMEDMEDMEGTGR